MPKEINSKWKGVLFWCVWLSLPFGLQGSYSWYLGIIFFFAISTKLQELDWFWCHLLATAKMSAYKIWVENTLNTDIQCSCQIRQTEIPIHLVWTSEKETGKIKRTKLPFKFCIDLTSKWKNNFICSSLRKPLQSGKEVSQICLNIKQAQICHLI